MKRHSIALAIWLLRSLTLGPHAEAISGDLEERAHEGRSAGWLWRQVALAIVIGTCQEVRRHCMRIAFGLAVGWVFLWAFVGFAAVPIVELDRELFVRGTYFRWNWWHAVAPWVVLSAGLLAAGWSVARASPMAAVLTFATSVAVAIACVLALDPAAGRTPQPGAPLWFPVVFWVTAPFTCIVLGGVLGQSRVSAQQRVRDRSPS